MPQILSHFVPEGFPPGETNPPFPVAGSNEVQNVRYVNPRRAGKPPRSSETSEVSEFQIGGYQVLHKWLKDRKGRKLSFDDLFHYQKVVVALQETMRLMQAIDDLIPNWPIE